MPTGFANSVDDDLLMIASDDPRTISFYRRSSGDTFAAAVSVTGVLREPIAFGTLDGAGAILPRGSVRFHLQASQIGSRARFGDKVTEGSTSYDVLECEVLDEDTRYVLTCVPQV